MRLYSIYRSFKLVNGRLSGAFAYNILIFYVIYTVQYGVNLNRLENGTTIPGVLYESVDPLYLDLTRFPQVQTIQTI